MTRVELVGLERYTIHWDAALDETSPVESLRYRVYHIVEPYLTLTDEMSPILTSEPGALQVTLANAGEPGRFFVRAVDEAGNASALTPGLMQRSARPLVRASDGRLAAAITGCVAHPSGTLCVGEEGFAARWTPTGWLTLDLGVVAPLRLARTPAGVFAYSELGHLFGFDDAGDPDLVELKFPLRAPDLPFRQFAADGVGLRYWIDAGGRMFVGAHDEFVPMTRPIAVPGDVCRRLRGVAYGERASVALCEGDAAFSRNPRDPGSQWLSLTPNAAFELPNGLDGLIAERDTEMVLFEPGGVRQIGVGGWGAMLLADWHAEGVHPMDVPDEPFDVSAIRGLFGIDDLLYAVTDIGLLSSAGGDWDMVPGTAGALAGALPTADGISLIYEDGAVGALSRGRVTWSQTPTLSGFDRGFVADDGTAIASLSGATAGSVSGALWAWLEDQWVDLNIALPTGNVAGLAGTRDRLVLYGDVNGVGAIWTPGRAGFTNTQWRYAPRPVPVEPGEAPSAAAGATNPTPPGADDGLGFDDAMVFDDGSDWSANPPPPLVGVVAANSDDAPAPEPFVHLDVSADGRGVAISEHQVWWRMQDTWRYLGSRPGTLSAVFLDARDTYVLIEDGAAIRCWRSECEDVAPLESGPSSVLGPLRGAGPDAVVDGTGQVHVFTAATYEGEPLITPSLELPVGTWAERESLGRFADAVDYAAGGDSAALITESGELYERAGEGWELQGEIDDVLSLLAVDDGWAILTPRGLFRLGVVRPALRESTDP